MKDTITIGTIAGIVSTIILDILSFIYTFTGIKATTPWDIGTDVFLTSRFIGTTSGLIIGLAATFALGIGTALILAYVLRYTGKDYAWLKGILVANVSGFGGMGLLMPALKIYPHVQQEPLTNIFAIINLSIFGLAAAYIIKKYGKIEVQK